jgi:hypothetical protein
MPEAAVQQVERLSWRFPRTFWFANAAELCERAAYFGMFITLYRYLNTTIGFADRATGPIAACFAGGLYFLPTFMGILADRIGFKQPPGYESLQKVARKSSQIRKLLFSQLLRNTARALHAVHAEHVEHEFSYKLVTRQETRVRSKFGFQDERGEVSAIASGETPPVAAISVEEAGCEGRSQSLAAGGPRGGWRLAGMLRRRTRTNCRQFRQLPNARWKTAKSRRSTAPSAFESNALT